MPDLIEAGIEIFNPVQTNAWNMAPDFLKKNSDRIVPSGAVVSKLWELLIRAHHNRLGIRFSSVLKFSRKGADLYLIQYIISFPMCHLKILWQCMVR